MDWRNGEGGYSRGVFCLKTQPEIIPIFFVFLIDPTFKVENMLSL